MLNKVELIYRSNRTKNEAGTVHRYMKLQELSNLYSKTGKDKRYSVSF